MVEYNLLIFCILLHLSKSLIMPFKGELVGQITATINYYKNSEMPPIPGDVDLSKPPKISVVVPVYNGEKVMKTLVRSIQHQTLQEFEILFVDDGSTDNSYNKMKELQKEDTRITIIKNKKNRGILYSRMYGALKSKGEYIAFMDVDDSYINPVILEQAYQISIQNNLDACQYDFYGGNYDTITNQFTEFKVFATSKKDSYNKVMTKEEIKREFFYITNNEDLLSGVIYDKIYKKSLMIKIADYIGEDFWNKHLVYMEDFIINLALVKKTKRYYYLGLGGVWHWFDNPEGMTFGTYDMNYDMKKTSKELGDYITIWEKCFDLTEEDSDYVDFRFKILDLLLKKPESRHLIAKTVHFERLFNLFKRFYFWKYSNNETKEKIRELAEETLQYEIPLKEKYSEFELPKKRKKNKKTKKKKKKKIVEEEEGGEDL